MIIANVHYFIRVCRISLVISFLLCQLYVVVLFLFKYVYGDLLGSWEGWEVNLWLSPPA